MSIQGNNGFLDLENASLRVTGNVHAEGFKVGSVRLQSAYSLQSITGVSNVTNDMIQFTNPTKSFDATSNIEVGNGNLFVDTTTSNVGIGTNVPTSTLDVRGDASVSGNTSVSGNVSVGEVIGLSFGNIPTINFDQVSNVSQIKSNSNVVMEYKLSTRDYETKEPRIALTANSDRGYVASASKEESTSRQAWKIFNNVQAEGDGWRSTSSDIEYNASGTYVGSSNLGTGAVNGEWVQIQLPYKIKLERFTLQPRVSTPIVPGSSPSLNYGRSEFIKNGKIYGSNDGVSWSLVHTITGISASTDTSIVSVIVDSSSAYYKYFGLVITDTNTSSASAAGTALSEWELYGTPFTANVATGTDVVLHTTPNVPKLDFSNVYYDGQDYTSMPATVADKSGNGVTGTPSGGVGFDSTYKAFTFDGVDDKITAFLTNPAGAWVHSASMWFKVNSLGATNTLFSIDNDTTGENNRTPIFDIHTDGNLRYEFWDNAIYFGGEGTIVPNKWYHLSTTYSGGSDAPSRKVFLNGVELGISSTSGSSQNTALNAHANAILKIGVYPASTFPFNGSIANFRLYNQALSADEIWELYAYQKEYFGVSPDVVTLKAGRLGIGTSEPRAVLDVRGKLFANTHTGGLTTFLTADYVDNIDATYNVLDSVLFTQTFNIPSEYHSLGTANLEMYVSYRWCGETDNIWDATFKIRVINSNGTYYSANNSDQGNRNSGCGMGALSYHTGDNSSTLDSAIASSRFYLPNAPVGPGSTFNVQPVIGLSNTRRVTTNRVFSNSNSYNYERGTTNFFIVIKVVE